MQKNWQKSFSFVVREYKQGTTAFHRSFVGYGYKIKPCQCIEVQVYHEDEYDDWLIEFHKLTNCSTLSKVLSISLNFTSFREEEFGSTKSQCHQLLWATFAINSSKFFLVHSL